MSATVAADYEQGSHRVPLSYVHPVTGQHVDVDVIVVADSSLPRPGATITAAPDPTNPDRVVLPGDAEETAELLFVWVTFVGPALAGASVRWIGIGRRRRLVRASRPSFAMLAALSTAGLNAYKVRCSLYALDAPRGSPPLCSFLTLTTGGLPIDGPAFPVEVRGRPVPGGVLVARQGSRLIWPMRASLSRRGTVRPAVVIDPPALPVTGGPPDARGVAALWRCLGLTRIGVVIGLLAVTAAVVLQLVHGERRDDRLARDGRAVIVEVVDKHDTTLTVRYTEDDGTPRITDVGGSDEREVGRLYPARVDPEGYLRLDADPYDSLEPSLWLAGTWAVTALLVWPRLRWWRDARRSAQKGPWMVAIGTFAGPNLGISAPQPGVDGYATTCRVASKNVPLPELRVAGSLDPGEPVALAGGCISRARAWRWGHGARRR